MIKSTRCIFTLALACSLALQSAPTLCSAEAQYLITESELATFENELTIAKTELQKLKQNEQRQKQELTLLKNQLALSKKALQNQQTVLQESNKALTDANELLNKYEQEEKSKKSKLKAQRNIAYVVIAGLVYAYIKK